MTTPAAHPGAVYRPAGVIGGPVAVPAMARGLTRRWRMRAPDGAGGDLVERVLRARGLDDPAQAAQFLEPRLTHLHDPALLPDVDRAATRLLAAAGAGEPIVIYGDYDADGITATAILYHILRALAPAAVLSTYVPHRIEEGYGLNAAAIRQLGAEGARVIVSVDCGITAIEPARAAREAGVDLIITDHHNPPAPTADGAALPDAYALVHPRRPGSAYPFGDLCGAGVAFKLAWRLATLAAGGGRAAPPIRELLVELLPFAALGAIADVVPLVGENRVMARFGLDRIKHTPIEGLRALVEASGLGGANVDSWDAGFRLAPRLNACGRMAHAREAVELFTVARGERAAAIAAQLTELNNQRRLVERAIFEQACALAEAAGMTGPDRRAIVLSHAEWHPGVVGIVCSRLVERFGRPAILLAESGEGAQGSGRSIDGFNMHAALGRCSDLLDRFGGHDMAAGLHVRKANLPALVERFTTEANAGIEVDQLTPEVTIDADAGAEELDLAAVRRLESLAPFGRGNPAVRVLLRGLVLDALPTPLGQRGRHLALSVRSGRSVLRLVAWGWGEHRARLVRGMPIEAVVRPAVSTWGGRARVEPELQDLRPV